MKFERIDDETFWDIVTKAGFGGTGKIGEIRGVTYAQMVATFGEALEGDDDKTRVEWLIRFDDGSIANIYDYKERVGVERVTRWSIGGFDVNAVANVRNALAHITARVTTYVPGFTA